MLVAILVILHWTACAWILLNDLENMEGESLYHHRGYRVTWAESRNIHDSSFGVQYVHFIGFCYIILIVNGGGRLYHI